MSTLPPRSDRPNSPGENGNPSADVCLGERFQEALVFAVQLHRTQTRKATKIPYAGHLLGVCATVIDAGGDEDEAIAALLHDGPEDQGGKPTLVEIGDRFGERVAGIVEHLSDTLEEPKPPWRARKEKYLNELRACRDRSVYLVSAADKLHNIRTMLDDYREIGEALWGRFSAPRGGVDILWYHDELLAIYEAGPFDRRSQRILRNLRAAIAEIRAHQA
jgi:(p)ppGpp synthase/HD superfamily hydrolase